MTGRKKILTDYAEITPENVSAVLTDAMVTHLVNSSEIEYLYNYYKGEQPILLREKGHPS